MFKVGPAVQLVGDVGYREGVPRRIGVGGLRRQTTDLADGAFQREELHVTSLLGILGLNGLGLGGSNRHATAILKVHLFGILS